MTYPFRHCRKMLLMACVTALVTHACAQPVEPPPAVIGAVPSLTDFWDGNARFELDVLDTGLPMGESDTVVLDDGILRSYVHASDQSLGVVDQCGAPVDFPGCVVLFESQDEGSTFAPRLTDGGLVCQLPCAACPCTSRRDHVDQQQYPRVVRSAANEHGRGDATNWWMVYEYRANTFVRWSTDGLQWSAAREVPLTGIWRNWLMNCPPAATIGSHPYAGATFDCLAGSPPGVFLDQRSTPAQLYVFVGIGQNPGSMGCYRGAPHAPASLLRACRQLPLFSGSPTYGPLELTGSRADPYFDFRTVSSAEIAVDGDYVYMFFEGVRGPGAGDAGDTQFQLGLARAPVGRIDGAWERHPANPILGSMPGNVGIGHADLVSVDSTTYLYTSLDGKVRSRLRLVWR